MSLFTVLSSIEMLGIKSMGWKKVLETYSYNSNKDSGMFVWIYKCSISRLYISICFLKQLSVYFLSFISLPSHSPYELLPSLGIRLLLLSSSLSLTIFQTSSPLKLLYGFWWNWTWLFIRVSCTKFNLQFLICQKHGRHY